MTTIGKDFPVRSDAFRFSSEKRASSAATSPARTECFDIFSAEPGDSDVTSQMERLSSKEMKIAARLDWMAVGASCRSATAGMVVSRVSVRNLTLPERWSLSTSPWDLVGAALGVGVRQNVCAADLVVEGVEAVAGFCLRFRVQRRLQFLNAVRS